MNQTITDYPGWKELPEHVKQAFEDSLNKNPKMIRLQQELSRATQQRNFVKELDLRKKIQEIRFIAQRNLINSKEQEVEEVTTLFNMGLPHETLDKINILMISTYMALDMIEFFVLDINSELKKADPTASLNMFQPIMKLGKEARGNLTYLWKNTSIYDTEDFNNKADNIREMLVNKAKKVYIQYAKRVEEKEKQNNKE